MSEQARASQAAEEEMWASIQEADRDARYIETPVPTPEQIAACREAEGTVTSTDGQLTVTPGTGTPTRPRRVTKAQALVDGGLATSLADARAQLEDMGESNGSVPARPRRKRPAKTGNPQADRVTSDATKSKPTKPYENGVTVPDQRSAVPVLPDAPRPPKDPKVTAKNELARFVAQAVADALREKFGPDSTQAQEVATMWLFFYPTGKNPDGTKWWPRNMPRPTRGDW